MITNNLHCVHAEQDAKGNHFMTVTKPQHVTVSISSEGSVVVNVNESAVFILKQPANIRVDNEMQLVNHIPGD